MDVLAPSGYAAGAVFGSHAVGTFGMSLKGVFVRVVFGVFGCSRWQALVDRIAS